ncbi:gamma-glutamylcyclotransferase [Indioceanicola profundi]|uniref:gamma-glutamylcyclotransferase n=1 Tax=Indioceanicola profundi TaxID=2220096 RepID=UPI0019693278|nr:gamma-glutamylcyclotransferase [Indioceanicola profundi]
MSDLPSDDSLSAALPATKPDPSPMVELGHPPDMPLWVFAYGSLMWNPGFAHDRRTGGMLHGWHRGFCVYSWRHRGTPEVPGAVLGLDRGGACRGILYRVPPEDLEDALDYLWEREMVNRVYKPRMVKVATDQGPVQALAFTVDRTHRQYCGRLPPEELEQLVRQGVGQSGRSVDYLLGLLAHLRELGIRDHRLEQLAKRVTA